MISTKFSMLVLVLALTQAGAAKIDEEKKHKKVMATIEEPEQPIKAPEPPVLPTKEPEPPVLPTKEPEPPVLPTKEPEQPLLSTVSVVATESPVTETPTTPTSCPTSTVGPTMVPITPTESPVTETPITASPVTAAPSMSPFTAAPSMSHELEIDQNADPDTIPQICPGTSFLRDADQGKFYYTDELAELYNVISPDIADNAGWYLANGWNRIPKVSPVKSAIKGRTYGVGTTTVTFTLSDQYGNTKKCQIDVTIRDSTDPTFLNCPSAGLTVYTDADKCSTKVNWNNPIAIDNAPIPPGMDNPTENPGETFALRSEPYPISYKATDSEGNSAYCNFTITVVDPVPPTFKAGQCKAEQPLYEQKCGRVGTETGVVVDWSCPATDNCDDDSVSTIFEPWVEIQGSHKFHPDHAVSSITCTNYTFLSLASAQDSCLGSQYCYITSSGGSFCATKMDKIGSDLALDINNKLFFYGQPGDIFPIPPSDEQQLTHYVVSASATDTSSNPATNSLRFSVIDGRTAPRFVRCPTGPIYRNLSTEDSQTTIDGGFLPPLHTTDCDTTLRELHNRTHETPLSEGHHAFHYTAEDSHGNMAECKFDVIVRDINELYWVDCPSSSAANLNVQTDTVLLQYGIVNWTIPKVYKRGVEMGEPLITIDHPDVEPMMAFPLGISTVTYTVEDVRYGVYQGVRAPPICEFLVTVSDIERPKFTGWAQRNTCEGTDDPGKPLHDFCGGQVITETKDQNDFRVNTAIQVSNVTFDCCYGTCQQYQDSKAYICQ